MNSSNQFMNLSLGQQQPQQREEIRLLQRKVAAALLEEPSVSECVVLVRALTGGTASELVAYVVPSGAFSPERLTSHLQALLPASLLPTAYVPLFSLPLTAEGEVDEEALASVAVIDSDLVQRWENEFSSLLGIKRGAVVAREQVAPFPSFYLSELLSSWQVTSSATVAQPATLMTTKEKAAASPSASKPLAISDGGPLPEDESAPTTLPETLIKIARLTAGQDNIIYVQADGSEMVSSYADLLSEGERMLAGLRKQGLQPGDQVVFQLELNQDIITAFWGCLLGGFIPVITAIPPTYREPNRALDQLGEVIKQLNRPFILTSQALARSKSISSLRQLLPASVGEIGMIEHVRKNRPDHIHHPSQPNDVAFFTLTSGSTGVPKCIMLTHANILARARGTNILSKHSVEDVILNWLPFDHIGSISDWHLRCIELGCKLVYAPKEYVLGRPINWLKLIDQYRITHSWAPNFAYSLITDALKSNADETWDLSCVSALLTAGEAVSSTTVEEFLDHLAPFRFKRTAVRPAFGMAEMGSGVTYFQPTPDLPLKFHTVLRSSMAGEVVHGRPDDPDSITFTSLGPPIPSVAIRIVDSENNLLPEETVGRLQVKGAPVSQGYYNNPAANKKVFLPDGWFDTEDFAFISNGELVIAGRAKESIIINGANFYSSEIEGVVESVPGVEVSYTAACAVRGNNREQLAIFFHTSRPSDQLALELLPQIQQRVVREIGVKPDYLIPVEKEAIPKTAIGKIQRRKLAKRFEAGQFNGILAKQGLHSFLAGPRFGQRELLIGLDSRPPQLRRYIEAEPYTIQKLTAYFTTNRLLSPDALQDLLIRDRFGTPTTCQLVQLREPETDEVELWPSVAEYFVYDELIYYALTNDERRNNSYKVAINRLVKDKIVVEIGTGKDAILARFCVEAGAKKVYAIEIGDEAYREAAAKIERLGLSDKITIIHGNARQVELPELADVSLSEIVGPIGGCEGAALIINETRHLLKPNARLIPERSVTKIAAIRFPDQLLDHLGFNAVPGSYTEKIFASIGYPFDLRVCLKGFDRTNIISNAELFEDLDFTELISVEHTHQIRLEINQNSRFDGFLLWLNLHTIQGEVIDILEHEYAWLPVYFPIFHPGIEVEVGEIIEASCIRMLSDNGLNPDYKIKGRLYRANGQVVEFEHYASHHAPLYKDSPFYAQLFAENAFGLAPDRRDKQIMPHLPQIPLTPSGAIDREKLLTLSEEYDKGNELVVPQTEVERQIAEVWQEVLGIPQIGLHANFFELGGHSLLLVQAHTKLQDLFGATLTLVDMFQKPTIDALANYLGQEKEEHVSAKKGMERAQKRRESASARDGLAVIGMSCRFPGADTVEQFWQNLHNGVESITFFTDDELKASGIDPAVLRDPNYVNASPILSDVASFDAQFFGYSGREAELMDPQQRLLLECAWESLERAGYNPLTYEGAIGIYAGASMNTYLLNNIYPNRHRLDSRDDLQVATLDSLGGFQMMVANDKDYLTTRISYKLNLRGPSVNVQTACSTGLVAIHLASQSLLNGECDLALAGGSSVQIPQKAGHLYQEGIMVCPDGHCRAFDKKAQGTIFGSGVGLVVLKRLEDALADGDYIYAVVKGSAINNDGGVKVGYMAPNGDGQAAVVSEAMAMAGVEAETIGFVEAHGTGTVLGDPIEISGLSQAFRATTDKKNFCAIGSVKTNVGHLQIASGIVGFMKAVLALEHKMLPPSLHFEEPNPQIDFANTPFYVNTSLKKWESHGLPRRAGVNSLGIGGTNAHLILEEAPATVAVAESTRSTHILTLSAKNEQARRELAERYEAFLRPQEGQTGTLADICFTANTGRAHFEHRWAIVAQSTSELREQLATFLSGQASASVVKGRSGRTPEIAFLFTGQGSQYVGMGRELYETEPTFRQAIERCDQILHPYLENPLLSVLYPTEGESSPLSQTAYTQPALFALEYALAQLWRSWGIQPSVVMGHSVGEYVAACVAGVLSLEDGLRLIAERGRLMQALSAGEMVAVGVSEQVCAMVIWPYVQRQEVSIAAINGPESVVISGEREAIGRLVEQFESQGVRCKRLAVSHAFHSPLMEPMLADFQRVARQITFHAPQIEIISNLTGELVGEEIATPEYWVRHLRQPVRFADGMSTLNQLGHNIFVEIGPKPTLLGMARRCVPDEYGTWLPSLRPKSECTQLLSSLGELYCRGATVDWKGFYRDEAHLRVLLPTYPFQRERYWLEPTVMPAEAVGRSLQRRAKALDLHPLLGQRLYSATLRNNEALFESHLYADSPAYLDHHQIFKQTLMPGAAFLEMGLAAAALVCKSDKSTFASQFVLKDFVIQQALILSDKTNDQSDQAKTVQLILTPTGNQNKNASRGYSAKFEIFSLTSDLSFPAHDEERSWTRHAFGEVLLESEGLPPHQLSSLELSRLQAQLSNEINVEEYYQWLQKKGAEYGPLLKSIERLWRDKEKGEALGRIRLSDALLTEFSQYQLHPALLDACFQIVVSVLPELEENELYLPVGVERLRLHSKLNRDSTPHLWSHVRRRVANGVTNQTQTLDVRLLSPTGELIAEVEGLQAKRASVSLLIGKELWQDWLYEVGWHSQPLNKLPTPTELMRQVEITSAKRLSEAEVSQQAELDDYEQLLKQLEMLSVLYVLRAFQELGAEFRLAWRFSTRQLAQELGIIQPHWRLLGRMLEMLSEAPQGDETRILRQQGNQWQVIRKMPEIIDPQIQVEALFERYPAAEAELTLLGRCGEELADVLLGFSDPLHLLFPEGDLSTTTRFYQDSPSTRSMNLLLQQAISYIFAPHSDEHSKNYPFGGRKIRVLEIGAGTGATTGYLLPHLPAAQSEYLFTDLSPIFTTKAQERFQEYEFVQYKILDIEQEPTSQGFGSQQFDLIVAANVLHATKDLRQTLHHIRTLLAPGGLIMLLEGRAPLRWIDLTFGLTEGWWHFTDLAVRPNYPLVSAETWQELLHASGFREAVTMTAHPALQQALVIAAADEVSYEEQGWLIFADQGGVGRQLAAELREKGTQATLVFAGTHDEQVAVDELTIDPTNHANYGLLFEHFYDMVVHLWSLDASTEQLALANRDGCGSLLHLVQALVKANQAPRLCLVTRGAQSVALNETDSPSQADLAQTALAQATLWGMGKVITLEHPEFGCVGVDLDPTSLSIRDDVQRLLAEINSNSGEAQVAFRGQSRYVARLMRSQAPITQTFEVRAQRSYLITGGLGGLGLLVARFLVERGALHLVLLARSEPNAVARAQIAELEQQASVKVVQGDVSQEEQMAQVIADIEPPLAGVIHAAGVLADGLLAQQSWERFSRVMGAKVQGAWHLHTLTENMPLDFFVLFSSAASLLGSSGQANHAAANAFLDRLASYRRTQGLAGVAINWGAWSEIGSAVERLSQVEMMGLGSIAPQQGLAVLEHILSTATAQVGVVPINWSQFKGQGTFFADVKPVIEVQGSEQQARFRQQLQSAPASQRLRLLEAHLCDTVANVLGCSSEPIPLESGFFDIGMDSLTSVELRNRLQSSLECSLPSTLAFDYPTLQALVDYLAQDIFSELFAQDADAESDRVVSKHSEIDEAESAEYFATLEELSKDEIADLLAEELAQ